MRILICGSRTWADYPAVVRVVAAFRTARPVIIHGGADGADSMAARAAALYDLPCEAYPVSDEEWRRYGKAAGPRRNERMLNEGSPHIVIAFRAGGESRGTDHMIATARRAGVPVWVVREGEII
jgi:hypothetical protein